MLRISIMHPQIFRRIYVSDFAESVEDIHELVYILIIPTYRLQTHFSIHLYNLKYIFCIIFSFSLEVSVGSVGPVLSLFPLLFLQYIHIIHINQEQIYTDPCTDPF